MMLILEDKERQPNVLLLTLNRADRANALNKALLLELEEALQTAAAEDDVHCVVITGAGNHAFSAGADINEQTGFTPEDAYAHMRWGQDLFSRLEQFPKPTIAAINGFALGGGLELALACDFRTASETARLGLPEVTLGSLPGWGGTQRLPRLIGPSNAKLMAMTGEPMSARRSLELALVNSVHSQDRHLSETLALASKIASHALRSLQAIKQVVHIGLHGDLPGGPQDGLQSGAQTGMLAEARAVARLWGTTEQKRAQKAFFARRKAKPKTESDGLCR